MSIYLNELNTADRFMAMGKRDFNHTEGRDMNLLNRGRKNSENSHHLVLIFTG